MVIIIRNIRWIVLTISSFTGGDRLNTALVRFVGKQSTTATLQMIKISAQMQNTDVVKLAQRLYTKTRSIILPKNILYEKKINKKEAATGAYANTNEQFYESSYVRTFINWKPNYTSGYLRTRHEVTIISFLNTINYHSAFPITVLYVVFVYYK